MLTNYLEDELKKDNVSLDEFSELALRLMNYGVLCREESQTEQILYDRFLRIEGLVDEYLALTGIRIVHDPRFAYLRLYPPGARVPGEEDVNSPLSGGLRQRLSQDEVALVLVLRVQYEKALREGRVDEKGYVTESLEAITIALKNLLSRKLPEKMMDRQQLFKRLRQMRLIQFNGNDSLETGESWLRIHPMILGFVSDDVLQSLRVDADADMDVGSRATQEQLPRGVEEDVTEGEAEQGDELAGDLEELLED